MKTHKEIEEIRNILSQFIGGETLYKQEFMWIVLRYTEGVKYFMSACDCYWLLAQIMFKMDDLKEKEGDEFYSIKFNRIGEGGILKFEDGNGNQFQKIEFDYIEDFPLDSVTFFYSNKILYLPSEH